MSAGASYLVNSSKDTAGGELPGGGMSGGSGSSLQNKVLASASGLERELRMLWSWARRVRRFGWGIEVRYGEKG